MTTAQVVVEMELDTDDSLEEVKSGPYENWAMGDIVEVRQLPTKARQRRAH